MKQTTTSYTGTLYAIALCVLWIPVTATLSVIGFYEYPRNGSHLLVIVTVLIPTVFFVVMFILSRAVRSWTSRLDLGMLTLPHAWRTVGFSFLVLWFYGLLPAGFAAPAGIGDFSIAMAAPFVAVALWLQWQGAIRIAAWFHVLGVFDLILALLTGMTGFGVPSDQMTMIDPMTVFPMVLVPTVAVPLLLAGHIMALTKITMDRHDQIPNEQSARVK